MLINLALVLFLVILKNNRSWTQIQLEVDPICYFLKYCSNIINLQCSHSFLEIFSSLDKYYNVDYLLHSSTSYSNLLHLIDTFANFIYSKISNYRWVMNYSFNPLKILRSCFEISAIKSLFLRFFDSYFRNNNLFYNSKESHIFQ